MTRSWRSGFDVSPKVAGSAPFLALILVTLGLVYKSGDIREGVFPWAVASASFLLAVCCLGLVAVHPAPGRPVTWGAWWATLAMLGIAGFFLAIAVGGMVGIDEEAAGPFAFLPVLAMAFGLLSTPPALVLLAVGTRRARVLPWWGSAALAVAAPVLPALLVVVGISEGWAEVLGLTSLTVVFGICWVVVGGALLWTSTQM